MTTISTIIISAVKRLLDQRKPSTFAEYISQATSCVETVQRGYEWKQLPERLRIQLLHKLWLLIDALAEGLTTSGYNEILPEDKKKDT